MAKRRKKAEWLKICEVFEVSGETGAAFCRKHGLNRSSFNGWRCRLRREGLLGAKQAAFVEVSCDLPQRSERVIMRLGKVSLEFFDVVPDPAWIAELAGRC